MTFFLACAFIFVGFLCGATSIGGILLIPAIQYCAGLPLAVASGTALCSFFFTAAVGTFLHRRAGNLRRELVLPQCLGALLFGCLGALTKFFVGAVALNAILASLIIVSGVAALRPARPRRSMETEQGRFRYLLIVGAVVGFMAGLTGMGGPVLSVPLMIVMSFPPLATVAAAQPFQMAACFSGSIGNIILGQIDWTITITSVFLQSIGVWAGVCAARRMPTNWLKKAIAFLCVFTGVFMLFR
jgi:uncharacterized membrane protein YfcA